MKSFSVRTQNSGHLDSVVYDLTHFRQKETQGAKDTMEMPSGSMSATLMPSLAKGA